MPGSRIAGTTRTRCQERMHRSSPTVRLRRRGQQWVKRIVYHDGVDGGEGGTRILARACRSGRAHSRRGTRRTARRSGARFAVDAYIAFARTRPWYEGVASSLTELFAPATMAERMAAWRRHYPWIAEGGTRYFDDRIGHAAGEGGDALQIVLAHCRTQERKQAAVAAVRFKWQRSGEYSMPLSTRCPDD